MTSLFTAHVELTGPTEILSILICRARGFVARLPMKTLSSSMNWLVVEAE
ncbi:MAG: hypothetical protein P1U83_11615 [Roseovarius sp.]|nr:hypothetical protein [Roseovarius sp.]